jgi:hypothetical protein
MSGGLTMGMDRGGHEIYFTAMSSPSGGLIFSISKTS